MSNPSPLGGDDPFEGLPMFRDLVRLFASKGPVNWDVARQVAVWVATGGTPEPNVEPVARMRLEELARVADLHVSDASGLATSITGRPLRVVATTRGDWALRMLDRNTQLLEKLSTTLSAESDGASDDAASFGDDETGLLGNLGQVMAPVLLGMQSGFMAGHLAQRALGQYGLPLPGGADTDEVALVPQNIDAFADDWSLPADDVRLLVCLSDIAHHAVIGRPHVRARLHELLVEYASGFKVDTEALEERLGGMNPSDPESMQQALGDPATLLGAMSTPEQAATRAHLDALLAAVEGYVDHLLDQVGNTLIGSYASLTEALRRRRVERGEGERFVERLFGLELGQPLFDRGSAFVRGVVERAGEDGLRRLWRSEFELPTPNEVDAPGLWLARIDLPSDG